MLEAIRDIVCHRCLVARNTLCIVTHMYSVVEFMFHSL